MSAPPTSRSLPPELDPRGSRRTVLPQAPVRRRRRRWARVLSWVAGVTSVLVLLATIGGYAAYRHYDSNIARIRNFVLPGHPQPAASGKAENYLLVGSDTRENLTPAELRSSSTTYDPGSRSDTVILAHVPADGSRVTLVSFPRDSYVKIPQWTDAEGKVHRSRQDKLNSAFAAGSLPGGNAALLSATVQDLTGMRVDHFVQIDFIGFQRMVNTLGGIDVCLREPARDKRSGIDLPAGVSHINGSQALAFVRQRYGLEHGDLDRIKRQQYFISAVMKEVISARILLNPLKLSSVLEDATKSVSADQGLNDLRKLALRLRNLDPEHVQFTTLPVSGPVMRGDASVLIVDEPKAAALFAQLRGVGRGPSSADPTPDGPRLIVAPSAITVKVYNGTDTAGLATKASSDLRDVGFNVLSPGTRSTGATSTVVRYGPTRADSARTLAAAVPGALLVEDDSLGRTLELVVGSSYAGAQAVSVSRPTTGASPSAAPTASASPPPVNTAQDMSCAP